MTTLVLGSSGQLASHLRELLPDAVFWGRAVLDLAQPETVSASVLAQAPTFIVNAAAYTAVDKAESEPDLAWQINVASVAELARAAARLDVPLVHVSSDYVFDGRASRPYRVTDPVNPINQYGRTKLGGEIATATLCRRHWILRASWVFSEFGANFVKTMLRLARERDSLSVVADQHGVPTYAGDLAAVIAALTRITAPNVLAYGTYHAVGGPAVTWYDFARQITATATRLGLIEECPTVAPIATEAYPLPARRPANSVLSPSTELIDATEVRIDWTMGLESALRKLSGRTDE